MSFFKTILLSLLLVSSNAWSAVSVTAAGGLLSGDHLAYTNPKVMVNGDTLFTATGDIFLNYLVSECYTANDVTASTLQWSSTLGANTSTISGVSVSLASTVPGQAVLIQPTSLANAPFLSTASGVSLKILGDIRIPKGSLIKVVIGTGSTTGTWRHYIRYEPLEPGAEIIPAF